MPATTATLISRTRRFVRDYPELDTLSASITSSATTLTTIVNPASGSYSPNWIIQVDQEAMLVKTSSSVAGSITVLRGAMGTTAATHASGATVLIKPAFLDAELLDGLNYALENTYPLIYRPVLDTSLSTLASTFEYTVPNMPTTSLPIPFLSKVEWKEPGLNDYREVRNFSVRRGTTPKIQFPWEQVAGATIRVEGYGPFPALTAAGSLDALYPVNAEDLLVLGAVDFLLSSGEAGRVRQDVGMPDQRENANRTGSSMGAANALLSRFERQLARKAMPPIPPHCRPTF